MKETAKSGTNNKIVEVYNTEIIFSTVMFLLSDGHIQTNMNLHQFQQHYSKTQEKVDILHQKPF